MGQVIPFSPVQVQRLVLLESLHSKRCGELGIAGDEALVQAAGVGMVIEVWRNSPVEAMHGGRRGPNDAAMFAESTALHREAVQALNADRVEFGLIRSEKLLLDRSREWAGAGGKPVKEFGASSSTGRISAMTTLLTPSPDPVS